MAEKSINLIASGAFNYLLRPVMKYVGVPILKSIVIPILKYQDKKYNTTVNERDKYEETPKQKILAAFPILKYEDTKWYNNKISSGWSGTGHRQQNFLSHGIELEE